ncbi:Polyadenylate-binding protein (RRM superfamily) [Handroanthus impetiginosus]|uniref:Polyadenylate-binding protein n=1 Tax=Handroanthus impetiginosus TaxID=429701 RepID=A0A2G9GHB3_9LAMI|nr:Polyadenylate-binding protein (RRM superfamily) [Handroanthus impetiginosus]
MAIPPAAVQAQSMVMAASVMGATPPSTPAAVTGVVSPNSSLYVGDLEATVDENQLYDLFNQAAPVVSVRVCRDQTRQSSLGYAYVNFNNPMDASHARDVLNFTPVNGKPIRIMFSHRDPSLRKTGYANLFIKNLDSSIDNKALYETFSAFGIVLSCKVAVDNNGKSKGYGFVQFDKEEAAQNAIKRLNGMLLNDKQVYVGTFIRRQDRIRTKGTPKFTNVYVKNLPESITDQSLKKIFEKFGPITSAVVMRDANGKSRCFGFVNFESFDSAAAAVENLNGSPLDDKILYVGKAEKKAEREAELRAKFEQERNSRFEKLKGTNLYLKNLDDSINDEKLKELFSEFGTITSCKIMCDPNGMSKGAGFVAFSTSEEAKKALNAMNGKMIGRKPLYVAMAQRKEERKAWLQAHFAQTRSSGTMSPIPGMPGGFHAGTPRLAHQQLYFGQVGPGFIPQAPTYGFQQPHLPGLQPGVPSNFVMPYQLQRQGPPGGPGQRMGVRRGGNSPQQQQQQNSNQVLSRYMTNGRNGVNPSMVPQGLMGPILPMSLDASAVPGASLSLPLYRSTLASTLASASPEKRRLMLGEHLYPLVERLEPNQAGKVTGMLLEMDQAEVLHLIESPDSLKKKVLEAMDVLRVAASGSDIGDQLGSFN